MMALIASIPILLVIILMLVFNWSAKKALPLGWVIALLVATLYWKQRDHPKLCVNLRCGVE